MPRPDQDHTAALDNYKAEFYFADVLKQSDMAFKDGENGCISLVEIDLEVMPHTMLVHLGDTNCVGQDGLARRGQIMVTFTGPYGGEGTVITITPQNYYVNDHLVQGVKTVTNAGVNEMEQSHFNVTVSGTITAPNGSWTSTHDYQRTRTWIAGEGSMNMFDDEYHITGGGHGINRNGIPFTVDIITPLHVKVGCPWIVAGIQHITPQGLPARIIDYGSGACDGVVSITVGQFTFTIGG